MFDVRLLKKGMQRSGAASPGDKELTTGRVSLIGAYWLSA